MRIFGEGGRLRLASCCDALLRRTTGAEGERESEGGRELLYGG